MRDQYKIVSLFSGAGGLDLGFKLTGRYEIVLANELLEAPVRTYSYNFEAKIVRSFCTLEEMPCVVLGNVEKLDFRPLAGSDIDVVLGGPPCQDFSIVRGPATKRRGIEVQRGRLYAHFVRALAHIQPKIFVFENVPGLVSVNKGLAYKTILEDFTRLSVRWPEVKKVIDGRNAVGVLQGYGILFSDVVDMPKLGLPQARQRLIIIGIRRDLADRLGLGKLQELAQRIRNALQGAGRKVTKYPLTPIEVFEGKPLPDLQDRYEEVMKDYEGVWSEIGTPKAYRWKAEVWDKLTFDVVQDYLWVNGITPTSKEELEEAFEEHKELLKELGYYGTAVSRIRLPDRSNFLPEESAEVKERMKRIPPGKNHEFVRGTKWEVKGLMSNIYRRTHPLLPAPTVIAYGGGGTWGYHYERNRSMLTNRERARLQTFLDSFLFYGTWSQVRAQIGEAVPPLVAKRIAEAVTSLLDLLT